MHISLVVVLVTLESLLVGLRLEPRSSATWSSVAKTLGAMRNIDTLSFRSMAYISVQCLLSVSRLRRLRDHRIISIKCWSFLVWFNCASASRWIVIALLYATLLIRFSRIYASSSSRSKAISNSQRSLIMVKFFKLLRFTSQVAHLRGLNFN
jgi:hypothetical protein